MVKQKIKFGRLLLFLPQPITPNITLKRNPIYPAMKWNAKKNLVAKFRGGKKC